MKYKLEMKCRIELDKPPATELAAVISAVLREYPDEVKRVVLQDLEVFVGTTLNLLDEKQTDGGVTEGGEAGEPIVQESENNKETAE